MEGLSLFSLMAAVNAQTLGTVILLLTVAGLPLALLQAGACLLLTRLPPRPRFGTAALALMALQVPVLVAGPLAVRLGQCASLADLGIDNIDHRFRCTLWPDSLVDRLNMASQIADLLTLGWPWLAVILLTRHLAQRPVLPPPT